MRRSQKQPPDTVDVLINLEDILLNNDTLLGDNTPLDYNMYLGLHATPKFSFETVQPFSSVEDDVALIAPRHVYHVRARQLGYKRLSRKGQMCTDQLSLNSWQVYVICTVKIT